MDVEKDLFSLSEKVEKFVEEIKSTGPLADRMRPTRLEEFFGQEALIAQGKPLRMAIEDDSIRSFILWGPPGTGKTTLARIIANHTNRDFIPLSAVTSGVKDIKEVATRAKLRMGREGVRTILFVDEIHRFSKSQQDALLPFVEDGTVYLIGATTENPSFELNSALLSRAPVYVLKSHTKEDLSLIIRKALLDPTRGLGKHAISLPENWIESISEVANGDARLCLTVLERVVEYVSGRLKRGEQIQYTVTEFDSAIGHKVIRYDAKGEEHYDTISAFIKSMRDSDPDAAIYYLARLLEGGEDLSFILRRMAIFASEDIGNADPRALQLVMDVKTAVEFIGLPEARINLAQGVTYLAIAPKSNASYVAINDALAEVRKSGNLSIPNHIRNAPTGLMKELGYGKGYKYAHDFESGITGQKNLPKEIENRQFYSPKGTGLEKQIAEKLEILRKARKL